MLSVGAATEYLLENAHGLFDRQTTRRWQAPQAP
jgi:hypothetical protein